jgi:hypothetical protein
MLKIATMAGAASGPLALLPSAATIAQVKVFQHELAVTTGHRRTARAARYALTDGRRSRFALDQLIKSPTVRTGEERQLPAPRHDYAPNGPLKIAKFVALGATNTIEATRSGALSARPRRGTV